MTSMQFTNEVLFGKKALSRWSMVKENITPADESLLQSSALFTVVKTKTKPVMAKYVDSEYNDLVNLVGQIVITNPTYFTTRRVISGSSMDTNDSIRDATLAPFYRLILNYLYDKLNQDKWLENLSPIDGITSDEVYQLTDGTDPNEILFFQLAARGALLVKGSDLGLVMSFPDPMDIEGRGRKAREFHMLITPRKLSDNGVKAFLNLQKGQERYVFSKEYLMSQILDPREEKSTRSFNSAFMLDVRTTAGGPVNFLTMREMFEQNNPNGLRRFTDSLTNANSSDDAKMEISKALLESWADEEAGKQLVFHLVTVDKPVAMTDDYRTNLFLENAMFQAVRIAYNKLRGEAPMAKPKDAIERQTQELDKQDKDLQIREDAMMALLAETSGNKRFMNGIKAIKLDKNNLKVYANYPDAGHMDKGKMKELNVISFCGEGNTCKLPEKTGFFQPTRATGSKMLSLTPLNPNSGKITISEDARSNLDNLCGENQSMYQLENIGEVIGVSKVANESSERYCMRVKTALKQASFNQE